MRGGGGGDTMLVEHQCLCEMQLFSILRAISEKEHKISNVPFPKGQFLEFTCKMLYEVG